MQGADKERDKESEKEGEREKERDRGREGTPPPHTHTHNDVLKQSESITVLNPRNTHIHSYSVNLLYTAR